MYRVIENFFTPTELQILKLESVKCAARTQLTYSQYFRELHLKALTAVADFLDEPHLDPLLVEEWSFHSDYTPLPAIHQDKDEELFTTTGELSFPLCSCVLYLNIKDLEGGKLVIGEDTVVPQTGMLVLLAPEVWHEVEAITSGVRHSINYNFWNEPLFNS